MNSIIESWIDSNQDYQRFSSRESIRITFQKSILSRELIWTNSLKSLWVMSWANSKLSETELNRLKNESCPCLFFHNVWPINYPGQARSRRYDVVRETTSGRFSPKSCIQPRNLLSLTEMQTLAWFRSGYDHIWFLSLHLDLLKAIQRHWTWPPRRYFLSDNGHFHEGSCFPKPCETFRKFRKVSEIVRLIRYIIFTNGFRPVMS